MQNEIKSTLKDLEIEDRSPHTILNYNLHLCTFCGWCLKTSTDFHVLRPAQAKRYRGYLYSAGSSDKTINTMIGTPGSLYEFILKEGLIPGTSILRNLWIRENPRLPNPLTDKEKAIVLPFIEEKRDPYQIGL